MDQNPKQQVAEKLRASANVLVTVSKNPSVDQLAAAVGLSIMLDALGKHTATVFSGQIPDILKFLEPEKTFDDNVDGLRDFIISLDKDKADKLRYKVEDDVVKIYITPYRSKITDKDLTFTQGDFNVDVVLALGVKKKADLDEAITAHGRILHDATVIAVNAGEVGGDVGAIDWTDPNANSLCEMLVSISEALEGGVLDAAMSTAFLTGIVSVTERFSNEKTTPKLMTMAAQLMAAGANQQLISKELQLNNFSPSKDKQEDKDEATFDLHDKKKKRDRNKDKEEKDGNSSNDDDKPNDKISEVKDNVKDDVKLDELEKQLQDAAGEVTKDEKPADLPQMDLPKVDLPLDAKPASNMPQKDLIEDSNMGGTFNATAEEAIQTKQDEFKDGLNNEAMSHSLNPLMPTPPAPTEESAAQPATEPMPTGPEPAPAQAPAPDLSASLEEARRAVEQAAVQTPFNPAGNPVEGLNAQPMTSDVPQQLNHDPAMPPAPAPMPEPMSPPVMPPQPPSAPPPMPPGLNMSPAQPMDAPAPPPVQQPMPPAQPAFDPNMDMGAQTFNIPSQQPPAPQQQAPMPPPQPQQPYPPQPGVPPAPTDMSQLPPPPQ